jgi:hypothetical protein
VRRLYGWNSTTIRSAPVGAAGFFALAAIALCFLLLHFFWPWASGGWLWAIFYCAYFLFAPDIACGLYSLVFEKPKLLAMVGLGLAIITVVTMPETRLLLDLPISLPFLFLGVMAVVKFIRWRQHKSHTQQSRPSG